MHVNLTHASMAACVTCTMMRSNANVIGYIVVDCVNMGASGTIT